MQSLEMGRRRTLNQLDGRSGIRRISRSQMLESERAHFAVAVGNSLNGQKSSVCGSSIAIQSVEGHLSGFGLDVFHAKSGETGH
jgi:hypothetical protein